MGNKFKLYCSDFNRDGGNITFEVKPLHLIEFSISKVDYDWEYEPADYEDGYCKYKACHYINDISLVSDVYLYNIDDDESITKEAFMKAVGMDAEEFEELLTKMQEEIKCQFESWAEDNVDYKD